MADRRQRETQVAHTRRRNRSGIVILRRVTIRTFQPVALDPADDLAPGQGSRDLPRADRHPGIPIEAGHELLRAAAVLEHITHEFVVRVLIALDSRLRRGRSVHAERHARKHVLHNEAGRGGRSSANLVVAGRVHVILLPGSSIGGLIRRTVRSGHGNRTLVQYPHGNRGRGTLAFDIGVIGPRIVAIDPPPVRAREKQQPGLTLGRGRGPYVHTGLVTKAHVASVGIVTLVGRAARCRRRREKSVAVRSRNHDTDGRALRQHRAVHRRARQHRGLNLQMTRTDRLIRTAAGNGSVLPVRPLRATRKQQADRHGQRRSAHKTGINYMFDNIHDR